MLCFIRVKVVVVNRLKYDPNHMIEKKVLEKNGAKLISFKKGDYIFRENTEAKFYYQILSGGVKMSHVNDSGNEFIQGFFGRKKSFGEPPLLIDMKYPADAISVNNSKIYRLKKEVFLKILRQNNTISMAYNILLSNRLFYKARMANGISSNSAEETILNLFNYLKYDIHDYETSKKMEIELKRKDIAGMLGISTETVIRTIKKIEKKGLLKIVDHKVYF